MLNPAPAFTLFPTPMGLCGIAWSGDVVIATQLSEGDTDATAARLVRRLSGVRQAQPPAAIVQAIAAISDLLAGGRPDLAGIACDYGTADAFSRRVYTLTRAIPPGEIRSYGAIALDLGDRSLARGVGQALGRNPLPIIVPCHRVLGADGRLTGFSAPGGVATKLKLLAIEGAAIGGAPGLFGDLPFQARR